MRAAGSREAFRCVEHDYPLAVAQLARQHGTPTYVLNSAIGANPSARFFYNRVKGGLERDLTGMGFASLTFVRPGVIGGRRQDFRLGERTLVLALTLIGPLLPPRWCLNPARQIARALSALIESALHPPPAIRVITSEQLS